MEDDNTAEPANKGASLPTAAPKLTEIEVQWRLAERQALALSKAAGAIPKHYVGQPGAILAAWLLGDELGLSRMATLRGMFVVNGRPQLSGDLLLAVARGAGVRVTETLVDGAENEFTAVCKAILPNGEAVERTFSVTDAKQAGLWQSSEPWKRYPFRMLAMRARGFCLRDAIPHKLAGVYIESELIDMTPDDPDV